MLYNITETTTGSADSNLLTLLMGLLSSSLSTGSAQASGN